MKTEIRNITEESIAAAGKILSEGGLVAFPTDTVYGLGALCTDEAAIEKLFSAKGRDEGKPISILVSDIAQVEAAAEEVPEKARRLMEKYWPGALTIVLKKSPAVSARLSAGTGTIGIRMPDSETARKLIEAAKSPLAAPSANRSGKRSAVTAEEVREDLEGRIDLILDGGACPVGLASTVVDLTGPQPKILREGIVTKTMIDEA